MGRKLASATLAGILAVGAATGGCSEKPDWSFDWPAIGADDAPARYVRLGEIRTNVRSASLDRRVQAVIDVGVSEEDFPVARGLIDDEAPVLQNAAIMYFAEQSPEALQGEQGAARAAADLTDRFNEALPQPVIRGVRFTELLVH